ncbi:MAG: hypothetical protein U1E63_07130 [Burkholderiales bacterium]
MATARAVLIGLGALAGSARVLALGLPKRGLLRRQPTEDVHFAPCLRSLLRRQPTEDVHFAPCLRSLRACLGEIPQHGLGRLVDRRRRALSKILQALFALLLGSRTGALKNWPDVQNVMC